MKKAAFLFFCILLNLQAKILVITHEDSEIQTLSKKVVQYLYLGKTTQVKGRVLQPLMLKDAKLHKRFCQNVLHKTPYQYNAYRARMMFTGRMPMQKRHSFQEVNKQLQQPNTIAYIKPGQMKKEWKVLYETP